MHASNRTPFVLVALLAALLFGCSGPPPEILVKHNQLGFYPDAAKIAVAPDLGPKGWELISAEDGTLVLQGRVAQASYWPFSDEIVSVADFTFFEEPGEYRLQIGDVSSHPFRIAPKIHHELATALLKAFYFHRVGAEIDPRWAGTWARPAGHPDDRVLVHRSAASANRPEGFEISSPGGWYDAGDHNKYVVNSAFATSVLLLAYEHYPQYFADLETDIPESANGIPDLVDEALVNLRWMLTMQDPTDGGVYHKLTALSFESMVMPHEAASPRYVVQKSTAAALGFAATTAVASRVLGQWPELEELAGRCAEASLAAWDWATKNPEIAYQQPEDVNTGTYVGIDENLSDMWAWAAVEMATTTGDGSRLSEADLAGLACGVPSWNWVAPLAWMTLSHHSDAADAIAQTARARLLATADKLRTQAKTSAYRVAMGAYPERSMEGANEKDFSWGSNGMASGQGMILLRAFELTGDRGYFTAALANLDYLLGRNPTGYSYVTGFGGLSPRHPHQRISEADGIDDPLPGWLVGGPHDGLQDQPECRAKYLATTPAGAYVDDLCSYATNEVAINWNAAMVYLAGGIEARAGR